MKLFKSLLVGLFIFGFNSIGFTEQINYQNTDDTIESVNKFVGDVTGIISNSNNFINLIDTTKINQLKKISQEISNKLNNSNFVRNIQYRGLINRINSKKTSNIQTLAKKINTLDSKIRLLKKQRRQLNALARKIPNMKNLKKAGEIAGKVGNITTAIDIAQKTGEVLGKYKEGNLDLKEGLNYVLDVTENFDKFYLLKGARYVEKTFEGVLEEKTKITKNITNNIASYREQIDYWTTQAMSDRLNNSEYKNKLNNANTTDEIINIINEAKNQNIEQLRVVYNNLTEAWQQVHNRDTGMLDIEFDEDKNLKKQLKVEIELIQQKLLNDIKTLNNPDSSLLYAEMAVAVKSENDLKPVVQNINQEIKINSQIEAQTNNLSNNINNFIKDSQLIVNDESFNKEQQTEQLAETEITEPTENQDKKIAEAEKLRKENFKLAEQLKKDPDNLELQAKLNASGKAFAKLRAEIGGEYARTHKYDTSKTVLAKLPKTELTPQEQQERKQKLAEVKAKILDNYEKKQQAKQQLQALGELIGYIQDAKNKGKNLTQAEKTRLKILAKSFGASDFTFLFKNIDEIANTNQQQLNQLNTNQLNLDEILQNGGIVISEGSINDFLSGIDEDILNDFNDEVKDEIGDDENNYDEDIEMEVVISTIGTNNNDKLYLYNYANTKDNNSQFNTTEELLIQYKTSGVNPIISPSTPSPNNPDIDGYQYSAWGVWNTPGIGMVCTDCYDNIKEYQSTYGHYLMGQLTENIPSTGSAIYVGQLKGDYTDGTTIERNSIGGTINLNINFGKKLLEATLNATKNGSNWATAVVNTSIQSNGDFYHDKTEGQANNNVVGGGFAGISGGFFGKNAEEVGGGFYISKDGDGGVSGVFRAKQ